MAELRREKKYNWVPVDSTVEYNWDPVESRVSQTLLLLIAERESKKTLLLTVAKEEKFDGKVVKFELRSIGEADDCAV